MKNLAGKLLLGLGLAAMSLHAQAATYNIDGVWNGTNSGFASSLFHNLRTGAMSGDNIGDIQSQASGTYNSNGTLDLYITITDPADSNSEIATAHLTSNDLVFDSDGWLAGWSEIVVKLTTGALGDFDAADEFTLGFAGERVCCNGNNAPNSLNSNPAGAAGDLWLTLWGSTNYSTTHGGASSFYGSASNHGNIGLDLRAELSPVPIPAAAWLFGTGLLVLFRMRKRTA